MAVVKTSVITANITPQNHLSHSHLWCLTPVGIDYGWLWDNMICCYKNNTELDAHSSAPRKMKCDQIFPVVNNKTRVPTETTHSYKSMGKLPQTSHIMPMMYLLNLPIVLFCCFGFFWLFFLWAILKPHGCTCWNVLQACIWSFRF